MRKLVIVSIFFMIVPMSLSAPDFSINVKNFQDMEDSTQYRGFFMENPDEVDWVSRYESNNQIPQRMVRIRLENFTESQNGTLEVNLSEEDESLVNTYNRDIEISSEIALNPEVSLPPERFMIDLNSTGRYEFSARYYSEDVSSEYSFQINSFYRGVEDVRSISLSVGKSRLLEDQSIEIESDIVAEKGNGKTFSPEEIEGKTEIYINGDLKSESDFVGGQTIAYKDIQQAEWASEGDWKIKQYVDGNTAETTFRVGEDNSQDEDSGILAQILDFLGL